MLAALVVIWAIGIGAVHRRSTPSDEWARLIAAGDALAAGDEAPAGGPPGLTARAAYLLAFHHAQDVDAVDRMRAAADRLERLGDRALAAWARCVAGEVTARATAARCPSP
jgi:hypothetical protein